MRINEAVAKRTRSFEEGRLGSVIRSVLHSERKFYSMQSIRAADGVLQTDAFAIHRLITAHFEAWFREDEGASTYRHQHDMDTWTTWEQFAILQERLGIPLEMLRRLWHAIENVPAKADLASALDQSLSEAPTYEAFCRLIARLNSNSAGGMSGLTYSMIKAWRRWRVSAWERHNARCWASFTSPSREV